MILPAQTVYLGPPRGPLGMGAVEAALWPTTGDIDNETASFAGTVLQLAADIFNANIGAGDDVQTFLRSWNTFVDDFNAWKDAAWFWNPTRRDQLLEYRGRFNVLLAQFRALGGSSGAQAQAAAKEPDAVDKAISFVTRAGIVLGVGLVAYVGFTAWKEARRL